ncbi:MULTISPECIES: hypothetical protein [unclassified Nitrosomonas]|nr:MULTISPECIES: hypothetical protein [unclassified Nitrosomonas]
MKRLAYEQLFLLISNDPAFLAFIQNVPFMLAGEATKADASIG